MENRRRSLLGAGAACLAFPSLATANAASYRIGYLNNGTREGARETTLVLLQALRELGYVEGRNLSLEVRYAEVQADKIDAMAAELAARNVDVIIAVGTPSSLAAKRATSRIPIVSLASTNPLGAGVVSDLARPGGNVSGIASIGAATVQKRIEVLASAVPARRRVGYLMNPENPATTSDAAIMAAVGRLGVDTVVGLPVRNPAEVVQAFATAAAKQLDSLALANAMLSFRRQIAELALKHRLPTVAGGRDYVVAGILVSYGQDPAAVMRRGAGYVDRILKGANVGDLPFVLSDELELCFNSKTARALGIRIPQELLVRANLVVD